MKLAEKLLNKYQNLNESTNAFIGIEDKSGKVKFIYNHWSGDTSWVGRLLLSHYNDAKTINSLIKLGAVSVLRKSIGKKHDLDKDWDMANKNGWSAFYGRDRGEKGVDAKTAKSKEDMADQEYNYVFLFKEKRWAYSEGDEWKFLDDDSLVDGEESLVIEVSVKRNGKELGSSSFRDVDGAMKWLKKSA